MMFTPETTSFGRHETFALRYGWITKGFQAYEKDAKIFDSEDAVVRLGVGRNMVNAIKYWLKAFQLLDATKRNISPIGQLIFNSNDGVDPYLEDEGTLWLLHWLLTTNPNEATAWYWFFNKFHKMEFNAEELRRSLCMFHEEQIGPRYSETTLKSDSSLITRMYVSSTGNTRTPLEDALDSPLSLLGLVTQSPGGRSYQSKPEPRSSIPVQIFAFAVASLMIGRNVRNIDIEQLMYAKQQWVAPGAIFRLTEQDLITKVEQMVALYPKQYEVRESAGLYQLYQTADSIAPLNFLNDYYIGNTNKRGKKA